MIGEAEPLLQMRNLGRKFSVSAGLLKGRRDLHAVQDVTLTLHRGACLGIVGESGCGKSTLASMVLGLLAPTTGEVLLHGCPISAYSRRDLARFVQPVFQDPYSTLNPRQTIRQIVRLPLEVHRIGSRATREARVAEMMDRVGLPTRILDNHPSQLSGGQRQRVAIARALILSPALVVCDEPTSALDVSVQSQILNLLCDLQRDLGLTYLFISHDLGVVQHLADTVAVLYLGRVMEHGPAAQVLASPGHPYTRSLLDSVLSPVPGHGLPDYPTLATYSNPLQPPTGCGFHPRCGQAMPICAQTLPALIGQGSGHVACHLHSIQQTET